MPTVTHVNVLDACYTLDKCRVFHWSGDESTQPSLPKFKVGWVGWGIENNLQVKFSNNKFSFDSFECKTAMKLPLKSKLVIFVTNRQRLPLWWPGNVRPILLEGPTISWSLLVGRAMTNRNHKINTHISKHKLGSHSFITLLFCFPGFNIQQTGHINFFFNL